MTFSQVLIRADKASTKRELFAVAKYLQKYKKRYSLVELHFAKEHFQMLKNKLDD